MRWLVVLAAESTVEQNFWIYQLKKYYFFCTNVSGA